MRSRIAGSLPARLLLLSALAVFPFPFSAEAYKAEVYPKNICPGDAFLVKLTGLGSGMTPEGTALGRELIFDGCGKGSYCAVSAVDIGTRPGPVRVRLKADGRPLVVTVLVKRPDFPSLSIALPEDKVTPPAEEIERIKKEEELLGAVWKEETGRVWEGRFVRPLENEDSAVFGTKRIFNGHRTSVHRGLDIRGKAGDQVKATNKGRVVVAQDLFFGGNTLVLDHGRGVFSVYMHLSEFRVNPGDLVSKGEVIGLVGSTGRASGPHLHFGIKVRGINANPLSLIRLPL